MADRKRPGDEERGDGVGGGCREGLRCGEMWRDVDLEGRTESTDTFTTHTYYPRPHPHPHPHPHSPTSCGLGSSKAKTCKVVQSRALHSRTVPSADVDVNSHERCAGSSSHNDASPRRAGEVGVVGEAHGTPELASQPSDMREGPFGEGVPERWRTSLRWPSCGGGRESEWWWWCVGGGGEREWWWWWWW